MKQIIIFFLCAFCLQSMAQEAIVTNRKGEKVATFTYDNIEIISINDVEMKSKGKLKLFCNPTQRYCSAIIYYNDKKYIMKGLNIFYTKLDHFFWERKYKNNLKYWISFWYYDKEEGKYSVYFHNEVDKMFVNAIGNNIALNTQLEKWFKKMFPNN